MITQLYFEKALDFITAIGIEISFMELGEQLCFLPGLLIQNGRILVDRNKLLSPGDILHEAAHIALVPAMERETLDGETIGKRKDAPAEEMAAIAWSYAACLHLDIDPHFVFHEKGYKNGGASIVENFKEGSIMGVPILQWFGMTGTNGSGIVYPQMIKWTRD
jgi:hypothetical protein